MGGRWHPLYPEQISDQPGLGKEIFAQHLDKLVEVNYIFISFSSSRRKDCGKPMPAMIQNERPESPPAAIFSAMFRRRTAGLTIIEVLVIVAILSIMASVGIPSMQNFMRQARMSSQAHDFIGALSFARSEAIKRGQRVTVCRSADGKTCCTRTGNNWNQGWIVFVNANNDNTRQLDEKLLRVRRGPLAGGTTLSGNTDRFRNYVSYLANGGLSGVGGTIGLCYPEHETGVAMVFIKTGRVRTQDATCWRDGDIMCWSSVDVASPASCPRKTTHR